MDTIIHILTNFSTLLILLGAVLAVFAIAGKIKTKWIEINFASGSKRLPLSILSFIFIALAATNTMLPRTTKPPSIEEMLLQDNGRFEWQWAGQNWIGNVEFQRGSNNEITASLDVNKVIGTRGVVDVMRTSQPGKVKLSDGYIDISDLTVSKNDFDLVPIDSRSSIEGTSKLATSSKILSITNLRPVVAFAGAIKYQHREDERTVNEGTGDIVLVKYASGAKF